MTRPDSPSCFREEVVRFGRDQGLAGILTLPDPDPTGPGPIPVLILGAGIIHKAGPSRISVELARTLGAAGHPVLRFDLSGIGDSQRSRGASLEEAVIDDIRSAITLLDESTGNRGRLAVVGFCSGADNGFHVAGLESRIRAVAMFDPTVHPTRGFHRRKTLARIRSPRTWFNIFSGRSLWLRAKEKLASHEERRPPGYYGLLVSGPEATDRHAARLVETGVRLLYCMSRDALAYCNAPGQVRESLPAGFSEEFMTVAWRPDLDHIFSEPSQRQNFSELVCAWLSNAHHPGR